MYGYDRERSEKVRRNIVIDFNYKGEARHEVYIIEDLNDNLEFLPNQIVENYKKNCPLYLELVGITEVCGKHFDTPQELEKAATSKQTSEATIISWYNDIPAGLKTLWQEPKEKLEMFRRK